MHRRGFLGLLAAVVAAPFAPAPAPAVARAAEYDPRWIETAYDWSDVADNGVVGSTATLSIYPPISGPGSYYQTVGYVK